MGLKNVLRRSEVFDDDDERKGVGRKRSIEGGIEGCKYLTF